MKYEGRKKPQKKLPAKILVLLGLKESIIIKHKVLFS